MKRRILVVEDDVLLARALCDNLSYEGFEVALASEGHGALKKIESYKPDLILLDIMLPGLNGFDICRHLSQQSRRTAVIIITARSQKDDKLLGFQLGADDYVTKPFTVEELFARIHAVLRRVHPAADMLVLGQFSFDFKHYSATRGKQAASFTQREMEVLHYMSERPGMVVTREELLRKVWGYQHAPLTRCVDHLIARLRIKIEPDPRHPKYIHTAHGDGYRLNPDREI
jgi:DNA-binding response OmpR family regulator